jgi:hypothetical protein
MCLDFLGLLYVPADGGDNKPSISAQQNFTGCTQSKRHRASYTFKTSFSQSKHMDRRAHYIRHLYHARKLNYKHIPGTENLADAFTKALPGTKSKKNRNNMATRLSRPG